MLQDLCPRCGSDRLDADRACAACGFDPVAHRPAVPSGITLRPLEAAALAIATLGVAVIAFGAGMRLAPTAHDATSVPEVIAATPTARLSPPADVGRVVFAERLDDGLALVGYRSQFTEADTIAWRAEFADPPRSAELTLVIAWTSIRETMQLSSSPVTLTDPELPVVARDEVRVDDLVPTAGLYTVAYFDGDTKLAEGTFELLPPGR